MSKFNIEFFLLFGIVFLTGCLAVPSFSEQPDKTVELQNAMKTAQESTAVFETAVAAAMTEEAPPPTATNTEIPPTATYTSTPEHTDTPIPTETPENTETPTAEPTSENPWVMQSWCETHVGCEKFEVKNKMDSWAQITLTYLETGFTKFFTVRPRGRALITLRPGRYKYVFNFCGETHEGIHPLSGRWYVVAKCNY